MTGSVAARVLRLAVLLEAGLDPLSAWRYLAADDPVAARIAEVDGADRLPAAILAATRDGPDAVDWACVAAAWRVAADAGAPLAATLGRLGEVLAAADDARREVEIALAGPKATSRVVLALPDMLSQATCISTHHYVLLCELARPDDGRSRRHVRQRRPDDDSASPRIAATSRRTGASSRCPAALCCSCAMSAI